MIFYMLGLLSYYRIAGKPVPLGICLAFFCIMTIPPVTTMYVLLHTHWIFQLFAFVEGWICWTFLEYFIHRFLMHNKNNRLYHHSMHADHHRQPEKIFLTGIQRGLFTLAALVVLYLGLFYTAYLLLPAGIITGYALYGYMHVLLHSEYLSGWFKRLREYHLIHHLGQTERCFGVTVIWWDLLFNTGPRSGKPINIKLKNFFYGKNKTEQLSHP